LKRLGHSFQRSRKYFHSPDEQYTKKESYLKRIVNDVEGESVIYWDGMAAMLGEVSMTKVWAPQGGPGPKVNIGLKKGAGSAFHVVGGLEKSSGKVFIRYPKSLTRHKFVQYLEEMLEWTQKKRMLVVLDNLPVHFHKDVLQKLETQEWPFAYRLPPSWGSNQEAARFSGNLPIQLVPLPTYSPWLNPIEKLWRKLRQEVLHAHRLVDSPSELILQIRSFFDRCSSPSLDLLRYVGLLPD
jgi:transposase